MADDLIGVLGVMGEAPKVGRKYTVMYNFYVYNF